LTESLSFHTDDQIVSGEMGNSISCHQPCCRWTTDVDGELAVEGKRLGKPGEEEPKMNFDTNVIGPANINLIGGGNGLQLQQELKLFEDSRFPKPHPRDNSRGKSSSPKDKTEREGPSPAAKASLDGTKSKEGSSRPGTSRSQATGPTPVTQSAKQFADAFSREVLKIDRERVNKNTKPRFQESIRIMPTSAWSKLYAAFPARATSPVEPEATASTLSIPSKSAEVSATVQKALHSIVPAQWSSFHRHWTCQKTVAEMMAIAIPEIRNSDAVATVATVASLASASLAKMAKEAVTKAVTKEISMVFSSASPAMWSPLHRKWCGHEVLKQSLKQSLKPSKAPKAIQKLALAKDYGLLPGLASSMLDAALNIEVKVPTEAITKVLKAEEVPAPAPIAPIVKCSVAPAIYSKWHRHWTGGRAS